MMFATSGIYRPHSRAIRSFQDLADDIDENEVDGDLEPQRGVGIDEPSPSPTYTIFLWNVDTYEKVGKLLGHWSDVQALAFSYDNSLLASGSQDCTARVWDVTTKAEIMKLQHGNHVISVEFNRAGTKLLTGSETDDIYVWDLDTEECICFGDTMYLGPCFNFNENRIIISVDDDTEMHTTWDDIPFGFAIYDATSQEMQLLVKDDVVGGPKRQMLSIAANPVDDTFATGNPNGSISVWSVSTGALLLTVEGHKEVVTSLCYSPDGKRLFSAGYDKKIKVWEPKTGKRLKTIQANSEVRGLAYCPTNDSIACALHSGRCKIFDSISGKLIKKFEEESGVLVLCFSH